MTTTVEPRQLRSFGLLVGGVFALLAVWPVVRHGLGVRIWALIPAAFLVVPALLAPPLLRPLYVVWMALGRILGWINTRIVLAIVFYGLITPIGSLLRLMGKDPMRRSFDRDAETYRQVRDPRPGSHMTRQF